MKKQRNNSTAHFLWNGSTSRQKFVQHILFCRKRPVKIVIVNTVLHRFILSIIRRTLVTKHLTKLTLSNVELHDEHCRELARSIGVANLIELDLSDNLLSGKGIQEICNALAEKPIENLDLSFNLEMMHIGATALAKLIKGSTQLKIINIDNLFSRDIDRARFQACIIVESILYNYSIKTVQWSPPSKLLDSVVITHLAQPKKSLGKRGIAYRVHFMNNCLFSHYYLSTHPEKVHHQFKDRSLTSIFEKKKEDLNKALDVHTKELLLRRSSYNKRSL